MPQKMQRIVHEVPAHHLIAAVLQSDWIVEQLRRELRRVLPDLTSEQLRGILRERVLQHEVIEGTGAQEAETLIKRVEQLRAAGLTMTQTVQALTDESSTDEEEAYRILLEDKHSAGGGG